MLLPLFAQGSEATPQAQTSNDESLRSIVCFCVKGHRQEHESTSRLIGWEESASNDNRQSQFPLSKTSELDSEIAMPPQFYRDHLQESPYTNLQFGLEEDVRLSSIELYLDDSPLENSANIKWTHLIIGVRDKRQDTAVQRLRPAHHAPTAVKYSLRIWYLAETFVQHQTPSVKD
jgi:hypothetical protein